MKQYTGSLAENLAAASTQRDAARSKKREKATPRGYQVVWEDAYRSGYPTERWPGVTDIDATILAKAFKRGDGVPLDQRNAFIGFAVTEFRAIIAERFSFMKNPPSLPSMRFVAAQLAIFWEAFQDRDNPNRKLAARLAQGTKKVSLPDVPSDLARTQAEELEKLRRDNIEMKRQLAANGKQERDAAPPKAGNHSQARRAVAQRAADDEEFGTWEQPRRAGRLVLRRTGKG